MSLTTKKAKNVEKIATSPARDIYLNEDENAGEKIISGSDYMPFFDMSKKQGIRCFFSGATGSGKSFLCREVIAQIKPKKVYIFSSIDDGDYDKLKCTVMQVDLNGLMQKTGADVHEVFEQMEDGCCCVFDDIASFGTKLAKNYMELRLILLQKARHKSISVMICEQTSMAGNQKGAREVLLNCQYFFCFPRSNFHSFKNLGKIYLGLSEKQIDHMRSLGRFVMINKNYPSYYISSKEIGMI